MELGITHLQGVGLHREQQSPGRGERAHGRWVRAVCQGERRRSTWWALGTRAGGEVISASDY